MVGTWFWEMWYIALTFLSSNMEIQEKQTPLSTVPAPQLCGHQGLHSPSGPMRSLSLSGGGGPHPAGAQWSPSHLHSSWGPGGPALALETTAFLLAHHTTASWEIGGHHVQDQEGHLDHHQVPAALAVAALESGRWLIQMRTPNLLTCSPGPRDADPSGQGQCSASHCAPPWNSFYFSNHLRYLRMVLARGLCLLIPEVALLGKLGTRQKELTLNCST